MPGIERQSLKKLTADQDGLLQLLHRWTKEAAQAGHTIKRIAVAYEVGRDGFRLVRWLRDREIEAYVIHPSSVPVLQRAGIRTASAEAQLERKLAKIDDLYGNQRGL
ncbi:hypothetical protein IVB22_09245 [Bradyrhizobium sp. 190]|uniref:hypothetical protein n=1 Tax=Bradyrhizobium sp. 190 TaxID=2782658 RepID=UPI001FF9D5F0|nr:hypothetical protein [Bradyrhizobium sp. 190]MCK1512755.1 hypothetical protein [Bradyrhizobium sp. 190]